MMSLPNQVAADVNVVDEAMRVKWLVRGRVEERREARHLMYVTRMWVRHPPKESQESFWRKSECRDDVVWSLCWKVWKLERRKARW